MDDGVVGISPIAKLAPKITDEENARFPKLCVGVEVKGKQKNFAPISDTFFAFAERWNFN